MISQMCVSNFYQKKTNPPAPEGASWPQNGFMIAGAAGVGPFLIHFRPGGGGGMLQYTV